MWQRESSLSAADDVTAPLMNTEPLPAVDREVDWARYGLDGPATPAQPAHTGVHDLFHEDKLSSSSGEQKPWWKSNFFVREPVLFGTWDGVFTSAMLNIFGVVIFLRTGWVVGNAGIGLSLLIIVLTLAVALIAALSAIGICERLNLPAGGVYTLLSSVLGAQIAASIGAVYCFAQAVAAALYCTGFGESMAGVFGIEDNTWAIRGIGIGVLLLLLAINIAGVKWVVKLQLALLLILLVSVLDFAVGTFVHTDTSQGFWGYSRSLLSNNTKPDYNVGQTFFTVFGVFFPTATGVFAGINMSGDLRNPRASIPNGTLMAIAVSGFLYILHVVMLGATCTRDALKHNYLIAEIVSVVGVLWLMGLYISSLSSTLGAVYGAPRILQVIAQERSIPIIEFLGKGRGTNNEPIYATLVVCFIALCFILIGHINTLAPIVTLPFMLTYCAVDYSYFALAMTYDRLLEGGRVDPQQKGETTSLVGGDSKPPTPLIEELPPNEPPPSYDSVSASPTHSDGGDKGGAVSPPYKLDIYRMPNSWYSSMCNRWVSLIGAVGSIVIMFLIEWTYTLVLVALTMLLHLYVLKASSGLTTGANQFELIEWIKGLRKHARWRRNGYEQVKVMTQSPIPEISTTQLTEDGDDYKGRGRYHHSSKLKGTDYDG